MLWLGALAINTLTGLDPMYGSILLALFALAYSLSGGLKAVAMTDIVQVVLLIFGGFAVLYIALNQISGSNGVSEGLGIVFNAMPEKFDMILSPDNPSYINLPGVWVLIGAGFGLAIFRIGALINILLKEHWVLSRFKRLKKASCLQPI